MTHIIVLKFLLAIQAIESNHGQMLDHAQIQSQKSIHFGDSAIGRYAMMPNTIKLFTQNLTRFKEDPSYEKRIAVKYSVVVLNAARGCPLTASILWLRGPSGKPKPADYKSPRYIRFVEEWETVSKYSIEEDPDLIYYCKDILHL